MASIAAVRSPSAASSRARDGARKGAPTRAPPMSRRGLNSAASTQQRKTLQTASVIVAAGASACANDRAGVEDVPALEQRVEKAVAVAEMPVEARPRHAEPLAKVSTRDGADAAPREQPRGRRRASRPASPSVRRRGRGRGARSCAHRPALGIVRRRGDDARAAAPRRRRGPKARFRRAAQSGATSAMARLLRTVWP